MFDIKTRPRTSAGWRSVIYLDFVIELITLIRKVTKNIFI